MKTTCLSKSFTCTALLAAAILPRLQIVSAASEAVVTRNGWSFDRCQFHDSNARVEEALQKKGPSLPLTGWTEFDFSVPKQGWYELWIGAVPDGWPRDLFVDGKTVFRLGLSYPEDHEGPYVTGKVEFKEANLFFSKGKHTLRFRRLGFPGTLLGVWELRDSADNPAGCIRARVHGSPIIEPGGKVSLRVTGGATSPTHYKLVLKNEMTGAISPGCDVDFPASATAVDQDVQIPVAEEGVYQILAQVDGKLLRPSDLKAGDILVAKGPAPVAPVDPNKLAVAGPFSRGAVLQRDKPLPVWGWTAPGEEVTVTLAGQAKKTNCGANGRWQVVLKPIAAGGPYTMTIRGSSTITVDDLMVGEVWFLSGQSNVGGFLVQCPGGKELAEKADYPSVRTAALFPRNGPPPDEHRLDAFCWMKRSPAAT